MKLDIIRVFILAIQFILILDMLFCSSFFDTPKDVNIRFQRSVFAFSTCCSVYLWLVFFRYDDEDRDPLDVVNCRPLRHIYRNIFSNNVVMVFDCIFDIIENPLKLLYFTIGVIMNCATMDCWRDWMKNWYQFENDKRLGIAFVWLFLFFWYIFFVVIPCVIFWQCFLRSIVVDEEAQKPLLK